MRRMDAALKKQKKIIDLLEKQYGITDERLKELIDQHFDFVKALAELDVLLFQMEKPDQEYLVLKNNLSQKLDEIREFIKNEYPEMYEDLNYSEFIFRNSIISLQNMGEMINDNGKVGRVKWVNSAEYTDEEFEKYKKMMNKREEKLLGKPQN
jgi:hypothetical protein